MAALAEDVDDDDGRGAMRECERVDGDATGSAVVDGEPRRSLVA